VAPRVDAAPQGPSRRGRARWSRNRGSAAAWRHQRCPAARSVAIVRPAHEDMREKW